MARYPAGHDGLRPKTQFTVQFYDGDKLTREQAEKLFHCMCVRTYRE